MGTEHINYPLKTLKKAVNKPANTQEVTDGQNCRSLKRIAIGSLKTVQPDNFAQFISAVLKLRIMLGRPRLFMPEAVFLSFTSNFVNSRLSSRISKGVYLAVLNQVD